MVPLKKNEVPEGSTPSPSAWKKAEYWLVGLVSKTRDATASAGSIPASSAYGAIAEVV